jgi:hypothetical protein
MASLVPLTLAGCQAPVEPLTAPNVLLIVVDCLRSDHVGAYGHSRPTTPNLDSLAADGTLFRHAFAQSHWTRPSIPSYLTGLYPSEHGLLEVELNDSGVITGPALSPDVVTVAEELQERGYLTAMVGEQYQLARIFNLHQGFDFYRNKAGEASLIGRNFLKWLSSVTCITSISIGPTARQRGFATASTLARAICRRATSGAVYGPRFATARDS